MLSIDSVQLKNALEWHQARTQKSRRVALVLDCKTAFYVQNNGSNVMAAASSNYFTLRVSRKVAQKQVVSTRRYIFLRLNFFSVTNNSFGSRKARRVTWALLLWPTWLSAAVCESMLLFVIERGFKRNKHINFDLDVFS